MKVLELGDFIEGRAIWEYGSTYGWYDGEVSIIAHERGALVSVEQEHAVDSYNSSFKSQALIPWDQWDQMVAVVASARPNPAVSPNP